MEQIFLHLLDMSMAAGWIVLAVLLLRLLLYKAPRWCICLLWVVAALRLVFPFTIESAVSLVPPSVSVSDAIVVLDQTAAELPLMPDEPSNTLSQSEEPSAPVVSAPLRQETPVISIATIAAMVWLAGVAAMLLYLIGSYIRLKLRLRTATRLDGVIYQSERVASPFIFGIICPRIYLPYAMPIEQQAYVLAHERAHLRRGDHIIKLFASLLLAVYWFHPLLWIGYMVLCRDLELACDEYVVREYTKEQRRAYAAALLSNSAPRRLPACPLAFGELGVKQRIKSVMHYKKPAFWLIVVAVVAAVATAVCLLTSPRSKEPSSSIFTAVVLAVNNDRILVDPDGDSWEASSCNRISIALPEDAPSLVAGDTVEIKHSGYILETYPAMLESLESIRKTKDAPKTNYPLNFQWSLEPVLQRRTGVQFSGCPIYYYGIDNITVPVDGKAVDLVTAIVNGQMDADNLFIGATDKELYDDGGSVLYRFPHYSVLKLHAITNVDIAESGKGEHIDEALFIGPSDMNINAVLALRDAQGETTTSSATTTTTTTASASWVANMTVTELVSDTLVCAKPSDGSREAQSANSFHISLEKLVGDKPHLDDVIEVVYDGRILEGYPAKLSRIQAVRVVDAQSIWNVQYPLSITRAEPIVLTEKAMGKRDYKVYYFGVSRVEVTVGDETMDLVAAVKNGRLTLEQLVEDAKSLPAKQQVMYKDGGSVLYKFGEYRILKMNKLNGDRSLFIGTSDLNPTDAAAYRDARRDLLKVSYDSSEKRLVSDDALTAVTPYRIYYDGIKSVQVQVDGQYVDLLEALKTKRVELSQLLSELSDLARLDGNQVVFGDGTDESGKPISSQQRIFPYYTVRSFYSEAEKRVEFIAQKSAMTTVMK